MSHLDLLRWEHNHDQRDKAREKRIYRALAITWITFFVIAAALYFFGGQK